ncbi:MAG: type II/IV secretion system protein, partial [Planctomycetes bacterium]|nr:type II/IV secretion system protein [Planctomycetota bacterium]
MELHDLAPADSMLPPTVGAAPLTTIEALAAGADFLARIPRDFARDHGVLSLGLEDGAELLGVWEGCDPAVIWNIGVRLGRPVRTVACAREALQLAVDAAYERAAAKPQSVEADPDADGGVVIAPDEEDIDRLLAAADRDLLSSDGKAPLVRLLDRLLFAAVTAGASDLHLQPTAEHLLIRQRVDGVLDQGRQLPLALVKPLLSRIKVMGRMDVAERLVPQDGRTTLHLGERTVDVRISTIPTAYGERAVLRLLDTSKQLFRVESLGMPAHIGDGFLGAARRASGIILVTGPTGSGKTTTLYATLRSLDTIERNVMTIEDPIEYELSSLGVPISQSQVNTRKGITFANGLRHVLRQDPDVIMVGEIRDAETARMAIQASLTGHLVFSTLHTNDALSAVTRLVDLGVEPY